MPVTQALPDGPYGVGTGTPGQDAADIVAFLTQKGTATDGEMQAAIAAKLGTTTAQTTYLSQAAGAGFVQGATKAALDAVVNSTAPRNLLDVVALGTSITNRFGLTAGQGYVDKLPTALSTLLPGVTVTVFEEGVDADLTSQMLVRLPALLTTATRPGIVLIETSINDTKTTGGLTLTQTDQNMRAMVARVRLSGATPVVMTSAPVVDGSLGVTVAKQTPANDNTRAMAADQNILLVDLFNSLSGVSGLLQADGVHPNEAGQQAWADAIALVLAGRKPASGGTPAIPSQVTGLTAASASSTSVLLSWAQPNSNNSAITDYVVQFRTGAAAFATFADGVSTATTATVTGLTAGTAYDFYVAAVNAVGTGPFSAIASATPASGPAITDAFTRANSATSLGTTEAGAKTWVQNRGVFGILSNAAYLASSGGNHNSATVTHATADHQVSAKFPAPVNYQGIVCRLVDASNFMVFFRNDAVYSFGKVVADSAAATILFSTTQAPAANDVLKIICTGTSYALYLNGALLTTVTDATFAGTKSGIYSYGTFAASNLIDDFTATPP